MTTNQPSAHVALNNNRLRAYADVIYLKDGYEFQIELFNPYQVSVLAKIYVNDNLISSSGLVIRPGQRYFLDRYIDKNKKFKFNKNILKLNFRERFTFRRGRVNCSLNDDGIWRWFGVQFSVNQD